MATIRQFKGYPVNSMPYEILSISSHFDTSQALTDEEAWKFVHEYRLEGPISGYSDGDQYDLDEASDPYDSY